MLQKFVGLLKQGSQAVDHMLCVTLSYSQDS